MSKLIIPIIVLIMLLSQSMRNEQVEVIKVIQQDSFHKQPPPDILMNQARYISRPRISLPFKPYTWK